MRIEVERLGFLYLASIKGVTDFQNFTCQSSPIRPHVIDGPSLSDFDGFFSR